MKENKLIAEFMGLENQILSTGNIHSWSDAPFFYITKNSKEEVMKGIVKYSKYHKSWDWLMPVIEKITELCEEPQELDELKHALLCVDIKSVYFIIVEFIKNQND